MSMGDRIQNVKHELMNMGDRIQNVEHELMDMSDHIQDVEHTSDGRHEIHGKPKGHGFEQKVKHIVGTKH